MTRKELENNRQFQITNAAIDYYRKYKDIEEADIVSTFEDGAEWADRTMIDKVCDFIKVNAYKYGKVKFVDNKATFDFRTDRLIEDLRQAMEE